MPEMYFLWQVLWLPFLYRLWSFYGRTSCSKCIGTFAGICKISSRSWLLPYGYSCIKTYLGIYSYGYHDFWNPPTKIQFSLRLLYINILTLPKRTWNWKRVYWNVIKACWWDGSMPTVSFHLKKLSYFSFTILFIPLTRNIRTLCFCRCNSWRQVYKDINSCSWNKISALKFAFSIPLNEAYMIVSSNWLVTNNMLVG